MEDEIRNIDPITQNLIKTHEYSWALFMGHLVIEKLLKALYVKRLLKHPLFSHDLL